MTAPRVSRSDTLNKDIMSRCFRQLERRKSKLLARFEGWHPEWLHYTPSPDSWSVLQVLDHLIRTETAVRTTSARTLAQPQERPTLREWLRIRQFLLAFRLPIRVRIPPAISFLTPGTPTSLDEVAQRWDEERLLLEAFLLRQNADALRSVAIHHPVVGAISLRDALRFLLVHMAHHQFQLYRLRWAVAQAHL